MSESYEGDYESRASSPESYQTGEGGSLPPSPGGRERVLATSLRRARSADADLNRTRMLVADMASSGSGVVDVVTSEEAQGEMGPHRPFGMVSMPS